jgi:hypothetical protein|tara:strand:+ start:236 stop:469 length:234 start_codon:yes stop_codon:yes gene_type:complete
MSRQFNPAAAAYLRMNLDDFNKLEVPEKPEKSGGLLVRSSMPEQASSQLDFKNPAVRVAKQMQVIRKYREEKNADKQ